MKLYILINFIVHSFILAQSEMLTDPGKALDTLRQNNAVVGILYFILVVQAFVIVKLWMKLGQVTKERVEDLKERIKAEEDLRREIQDIYTKLNINK